jgi:hypothetical protein
MNSILFLVFPMNWIIGKAKPNEMLVETEMDLPSRELN